jgi:hypothetical protein
VMALVENISSPHTRFKICPYMGNLGLKTTIPKEKSAPGCLFPVRSQW